MTTPPNRQRIEMTEAEAKEARGQVSRLQLPAPHAMTITRFTFCVLLAASILTVGCVSKVAPNPLAGWQIVHNHDPDPTIVKDWQDYIQKLPPNDRIYVGPVFYFEDGTGQHAVDVDVSIKGQNAIWHYAFFYDKGNQRVKVLKYGYARYQS
jgi:hypothetical protein